MADTGNLATLTFGTSAFTAAYTELGGFEQERPVLEDSDLSTTTTSTNVPGDLKSPGSFDCVFWFDPNEQPPIDAVAETITITYPTPAGGSTGATAAGTGYVSKWGTPSLQNNELMAATATVQWDGKTEPAWVDST